jgi:hypothetical protein
MTISFTSNSFTLAPATAKLLLAQNLVRNGLMIQNCGVAPCTFKFQSAPASATDGFTLDPASAAAGQGGSLELHGTNETPIDSLWAYSTLGTTVTVHESTEYA